MGRALCAGMAATLAIALLVQGDVASAAVRQGIGICLTSVVPSLFPFLVTSSLLVSLGAGQWAQRRMGGLFRRLFRCGGAGAAALVLGIVGGYPTGGRTVAALVQQGALTVQEGERALAFCNNAGIAFTVGIAGRTVLGSSRLGGWLLAVHVAAALLTGWLLRPKGTVPPAPPVKRPPLSPAVFPDAVQGAAAAMGRLCGFVVFFTVVLALLEHTAGALPAGMAGFLELTCGILRLTPDRQGFTLAAALLSWGGLSVHGQTAAVTAHTGMRLRPYLTGKAVQSALSAAMAHLLWPLL